MVSTSRTRPKAVIATPAHWRRPTLWPNSRSPSTARITTPVESTTCTVESGATASAATCISHAPAAIAMPAANQPERIRDRALASGRVSWTSGAQPAPRCLHRKPSCVTTAHTSASPIPSSKPDPLLVPRTLPGKHRGRGRPGHRRAGQRRPPPVGGSDNARSELDVRAEHDGALVGQLEVGDGVGSVARDRREQPLAPAGHARVAGDHDRGARDEVRDLLEVDVALELLERAAQEPRDVDVVLEAVTGGDMGDAVVLIAEVVVREPLVRPDMRHVEWLDR